MSIFTKISNSEKMTLTKHLSVMLRTGTPLSEALNALEDQFLKSGFSKVLVGVRTDVANGLGLAEALGRTKQFDALYLSLVGIGEKSGTLEKNLEYLSIKLAKDYSFSQKITTSLMYPVMVIVTAILVSMQMSLFVLPKLTELFESMEISLPLSTQILLWFARLMKVHGVTISASFFMLVAIFFALLKVTGFRKNIEKMLLFVPIIKTFIINVQMARFTRNLGIMLKSGMPLIPALKAVTLATENLIFKDKFISLLSSANNGEKLSAELSKTLYKEIPRLTTRMIGVGEKSGELAESLLYLGDFYEEEVDTTSRNLTTLIEPIMLLAIGLIVIFLALAIITPIYQFTGSIDQ